MATQSLRELAEQAAAATRNTPSLISIEAYMRPYGPVELPDQPQLAELGSVRVE